MTIGIWCASRKVGQVVIAATTSMAIILGSMSMTVHTCIKLGWGRLMVSFQGLSEISGLMNPLTWNV